MSCTGKTIATPSISCLDFLLAWDLSGAAPIVTITNNSTVSDYANLQWWFYVTSPSGVAIYGIDLNTASSYPNADVDGVSWTTKVITLSTPFGNPPCGQIEFSPNSPYGVTVFITDLAGSPVTLDSYAKNTIIVRPNGNDRNSCGNFGVASVTSKTDCLNKVIMCFDGTIKTYNNIVTPSVLSNLWTLVYPQDPAGAIPNRTATTVPSVNFPISINSDAYTLYFNEYATYDYGSGITVKVQYKLFGTSGTPGLVFSINCNTNLCQLWCQMRKFYELSKGKCGTLENADLTNKMIRLNWLYSEIITGILQPFCGIDVPALITEWKRVGNFDDNCDCGCGGNDSNFGFSNPTSGIPGSGGSCCPVSTDVIDDGTGNPPTLCPASYFPVQVLDATGITVIGVANDINELVALLNSNAGWQAYGIAFAEGNCKVGWFPANPATIPPDIKVILDTTGGLVRKGTSIPPINCPSGNPYPLNIYDPTGVTVIGLANSISDVVNILNANAAWQAYGTAYTLDSCHVKWRLTDPDVIPPAIQTDPGGTVGTIVIVDTTNPPPGCPSGNPYPLRIYDPTGMTIIGIANSINDVVTILNADASWSVYGVASPKDNCNVNWTLIDPSNVPPVIPSDTDTGGSGCVNGSVIYTVRMTDVCDPNLPITSGDFPMNAWVDFANGTGIHYLGIVTNQLDLITALNAHASKPPSITFSSAGTPAISDIKITNTDCVTYSGAPIITGDHGSQAFLLFGASHTKMDTTPASTGREEAHGLGAMSVLGKIPPGIPSTGVPWHTIILGNTLITADDKNGKVWYYDITNPLFPTFIRTITLTNPSGDSFLGTPTIKGVGNVTGTPSYFSLYFPTNPARMTVNIHYLVETITGTIWQLDMTDLASGVTNSFTDQRLRGKCPRCICNRLGDEPNLYFTQDGSLEQDSGNASGVTVGHIVRLQLATFNGGGIYDTLTVISSGEENVYAGDTDGINTIWFVGNLGTISQYNFILDAIVAEYPFALGYNVVLRGFAKYFNGNLYVCSLGSLNVGLNSGTCMLDLSSLTTSPFAALVTLFVGLTGIANVNPSTWAFSITALGNCLMVVAGDNGSYAGGGGLVLYKTDGSQMGMIQLPTGVNIFNVAAVGNIPVYTPNGFIP